MKTIILTFALFCATSLTAQWTYKEVTDGFDDPYRVAYTESDGLAYLKLENNDGKVIFFVKGGYYCDDKLMCDFVFSNSTETYKASLTGYKSTSSDIVFFSFDLLAESEEFISWFKKCSKVKIRVNESFCTTTYYEFDMGKSTSALEFMINKK